MVKYRIEPWKKQKVDILGLIVDETPLFNAKNLALKSEIDKWARQLKDKKVKRDILEQGTWVSWTGLVENHERAEKIRILAGRLFQTAKLCSAKSIGVLLDAKAGAEALPWIMQGISLGSYRFDKYKSNDSPDKKPAVTFFVEPAAVDRCRNFAKQEAPLLESIALCRDLTNEPGNCVFPLEIARMARSMAKKNGLSCQVISGSALEKQEYNGVLNVGKGSVHPPCMVILRYRPRTASKKHLALVGKGITFDSGGYCLKPPADMWEMKTDMAGAATVLYAMQVIARRKLPVRVTGVLCLAENLIDGKAYRPGDIFKARNGKSIHIGNTDAEGRLALTDGLFRAGEEKATHIVDIATLTGAIIVSLGMSITGVFANDKSFKDLLLRSSKGTGENYWEMPMHPEYIDLLKNPYADLSNVGNRDGGSIQAALFLKEFVPENTPWIHLDIAGTSFTPKPWKYFAEGATGIGLRTLVNLAGNM